MTDLMKVSIPLALVERTNMTDKQLEPCPNPWCESHARPDRNYVPFVCGGRAAPEFAVACPVCPMRGPWGATKAEASAAWNLRQPTPDEWEVLAVGFQALSGKAYHMSDCATSCAPAKKPSSCDCNAPLQSDAMLELLKRARDRIDEMERNSGHDYELDWTPEEETLLGQIDAALKDNAHDK